MTDFDLDKVLSSLENDQVGKNAMSLSDMLKNANDVLGQIDKVISLIQRAEKSVICSAVVRMKAKEKGVELTPFEKPDHGIVPATDAHKAMLESINKMSVEQLNELIEAAKEHDRRKAQPQDSEHRD